MKLYPSSKTPPSAGFSLIEVTIALGVIAYALLALVGLLAIGIKSNQESKNAEAVARIISRITSQYRARLASGAAVPYTQYYTFEGEAADSEEEGFFTVTVTGTASDGSVVPDTPSNLHLVQMTVESRTDDEPITVQTALFIQ